MKEDWTMQTKSRIQSIHCPHCKGWLNGQYPPKICPDCNRPTSPSTEEEAAPLKQTPLLWTHEPQQSIGKAVETLQDDNGVQCQLAKRRIDTEAYVVIYVPGHSEVLAMVSNCADQIVANMYADGIRRDGGHVFYILSVGQLLEMLRKGQS